MRQRQYGRLHPENNLQLKFVFLSLFLSICARGQVINSVSATATQALVRFTAPLSPACTIQVSENANLSPLEADVDPSLFADANKEGPHLVTSWTSGSNATRTVRIGLRKASLALDGFRHSRALATNTTYYLAITCNGSTATKTFVTGVPEGITPESLPTDSTAWGQLAFPEFTDFSKPVIEPHTGLKIYSADPNGLSSSQPIPISANWYTGGVGWTNLSNIPSYASAVATTGNTNALNIFLNVSAYNDQLWDSGGYWPYDNFTDMGLDLYGSGTDASGLNRTVTACLSLDSGQTCYTSQVTVALPAGSNAVAGVLPTQYPAAYFAGWGRPLPRGAWPRQGFVSVSAGVVTLTKNLQGNGFGGSVFDVNSYFDQDWVAGTKIFISGSSATCTNGFCTVASVQSGFSLTLVENLTLTGNNNNYHSAALALVINKTNATGTINLSARFHLAKSYPHDLWTGGCATASVVSGDGITGYPCIFPRVRQDAGALYFIGVSQPVIRFISGFPNIGCTNGNSNDCPNGATALLGPTTPQFDPVDPTKMYVTRTTQGGKTGLFRVQYTGTWMPYNHPYASTSIIPINTTELAWTNLTPFGGGLDLRSQILANTNFDENLWGSAGNANTAGLAGPYMILYNTAGSQNSACWIHAFTASTGLWYKSWRTDDSTSGGANISNGLLHYTGCHAIVPTDGSTAANGPSFQLANDNLTAGNTTLEGGPYTGTITAVKKGGIFNANTSLPWPPNSTYDYACPGGLPAWIMAHGAIGNQCVQVQGTLPCNAFATPAEAAARPCPYNASYGYLGGIQVGDFLKDKAFGGDWEGMMVVTAPTLVFGNLYQWTMQRNANFSYCANGSATSTPPKDGVGSPAQMVHPNGWSYFMVGRDACSASLILVDIVGNNGYIYNQNITRGHFDLTETGPQTATMIGAGTQIPDFSFVYPIQFNRPWNQVWKAFDFYVPEGPKFAGYQNDFGTQSYIDAKQFSASPENRQYAFDFRHYDPSAGGELEFPGQVLGGMTGLTLQVGTAGVYLMTFTGAADIKHQALNVWAGKRYLIDISSAAKGNAITDTTPWTFCYAYNAGECRIGSSVGQLYISVPVIDSKSNCWQSQVNLNVPCAFAGPTQAMQATQVYIAGQDPLAIRQRWLGSLLMGPEQQYVYSKVLPTPDASYLLFAGFLTSGYHTGLMMAKLPPFPNDSTSRSTFVPEIVSGVANNVYVEFGYDEFGSDGVTKFYCTTRAENCRVAGSTISEAIPFSFASEPLTNANGFTITIPALSGRLLYYRKVINSVPQPTEVRLTDAPEQQ
jgi:hypothetical protein